MKRNLVLHCTIVFACCLFLACPQAGAKNDKPKSLPPGLQKKVDRGAELPPGWQKKLVKGQILDIDIFNRGTVITPVDIGGIITIRVENKRIRLIEATREITEILDN